MTDYRNPKVTETSSGMGKWIAIGVAVLLAIAVIAWLMGAFNADEPETVPVVIEQEAPAAGIEPEEPAITEPAATAPADQPAVVSPAPQSDPVETDPSPVAPVAQ